MELPTLIQIMKDRREPSKHELRSQLGDDSARRRNLNYHHRFPTKSSGKGLGISPRLPLRCSDAGDHSAPETPLRKQPMSQTVVTTKDDVDLRGARAGPSPQRPLHPVRQRDVGAVRLLHGGGDHDALSPARRVRLDQDPGNQSLVELPDVRLRHSTDRRMAGRQVSGISPVGAHRRRVLRCRLYACWDWDRLRPFISPWA